MFLNEITLGNQSLYQVPSILCLLQERMFEQLGGSWPESKSILHYGNYSNIFKTLTV